MVPTVSSHTRFDPFSMYHWWEMGTIVRRPVGPLLHVIQTIGRLFVDACIEALKNIVTVLDRIVCRGTLVSSEPWRFGILSRVIDRQTPRILVCMPFNIVPVEAVYQLIIKIVIERHFGGECIRYSHPVEGDWRMALRKEMVFAHLWIFDLSFANANVDAERAFGLELLGKMRADKRTLSVGIDPSVLPAAEEVGKNQFVDSTISALLARGRSVTYDDDTLRYSWLDKPGLTMFEDRLRDRLASRLQEIGFRQGTLGEWVLYPKTPTGVQHQAGYVIKTAVDARMVVDSWSDLGVVLPWTHAPTDDLFFPVHVTLVAPAASFQDVAAAFTRMWELVDVEMIHLFGREWCIRPEHEAFIDADVPQEFARKWALLRETTYVMIQRKQVTLNLMVRDDIAMGGGAKNQRVIIESVHRSWAGVLNIPYVRPQIVRVVTRRKEGVGLDVSLGAVDETRDESE